MENNKFDSKGKVTLLNTKSPNNLLTLRNNKSFCTKLFEKNKMTTVSEELSDHSESRELVYDVSRVNNFQTQAFETIIDLLLQLRAADKDQSILVQNNTVLREQILNQLKSEILRVGHKLTNNQIKNLEVISSNSFDEKTLTEMLRSLLDSSKKKSESKENHLNKFNVITKSRCTTLHQVGRDYLTVLNKTRYYENVVDKVLKNVYHEPLIYRKEKFSEPELENKEDKKGEKLTIRKSLKETTQKKTNIGDIEILEEASKYYEENILNKSVLPKIIKLQSKIAEFNILTKVGSFVENIIKESVPKIISSQTELINRIVDKSEVKELRENIIEHQQQYINDKTYYDRNINRVYNEVRKFYNSKNISKNIIDVLKTTKIKSLNIEENVRKNVIKLASKKDILNRFKNIYEHNTQKETVNQTVNKTELINKYNTQELSSEEIEAVKEVTNFRRAGITIDKNFSESIRQNNILMKNLHVRKNNIKQLHKSFNNVTDVFNEENNRKNSSIDFEVIKRNHITKNDIEDYFYKHKNIYHDVIKNNVFSRSYKKISEYAEKEVNKNVIELSEKQIKEKVNTVVNKEQKNIINKKIIKPGIITSSMITLPEQTIKGKDVYSYIPVYRREKVLDKDEISDVVSKNIIKILSPKTVKSQEIRVTSDNIYKEYTKRFLSKQTENFYNTNREYLIKYRSNVDRKSYFNHFDNDYMVYKEKEKFVEVEQAKQEEQDRKNERQKINGSEKIKEIKQKVPKIDTKSIEKNIMSKTMSKEDIVNLIQTYMKGIDVESISDRVINKVERKFTMDRHRRGLF